MVRKNIYEPAKWSSDSGLDRCNSFNIMYILSKAMNNIFTVHGVIAECPTDKGLKMSTSCLSYQRTTIFWYWFQICIVMYFIRLPVATCDLATIGYEWIPLARSGYQWLGHQWVPLATGYTVPLATSGYQWLLSWVVYFKYTSSLFILRFWQKYAWGIPPKEVDVKYTAHYPSFISFRYCVHLSHSGAVYLVYFFLKYTSRVYFKGLKFIVL